MRNDKDWVVLLQKKILEHSAKVAVIGLGYVGLPLALEVVRAGFKVTGIDRDAERVKQTNQGKTYLSDINKDQLQKAVENKRLIATTDFHVLREMDVIIICVPTPLNIRKEPDMSYIIDALENICPYLTQGKLISLESTTYPGTTEELIVPRIRQQGLEPGNDVFIVFAPERIDPGNKQFTVRNIPKVVGGVTSQCQKVGISFYQQIIDKVVPVSSPAVAEMTKIWENTYRSVNIALVNELMLLCDRMGIDVWEVVDAAATKPFGIQTFYPGPGVGGHCISVDPFYLAWKAREFEFHTGFIELAGQINSKVMQYVVTKVQKVLNNHGKCLNGSKILVLGVTYKKDIEDTRESPALKIMEKLKEAKASISYHDPYVPSVQLLGGVHLKNVPLTAAEITKADCVLILTDHRVIDYQRLVEKAHLVVDTRNATKDVVKGREKVIRI